MIAKKIFLLFVLITTGMHSMEPEKRAVILVGPPKCGKTTALRAIRQEVVSKSRFAHFYSMDNYYIDLREGEELIAERQSKAVNHDLPPVISLDYNKARGSSDIPIKRLKKTKSINRPERIDDLIRIDTLIGRLNSGKRWAEEMKLTHDHPDAYRAYPFCQEIIDMINRDTKAITLVDFWHENAAIREHLARMLAPIAHKIVLVKISCSRSKAVERFNVTKNNFREHLLKLCFGAKIECRRELESLIHNQNMRISDSIDTDYSAKSFYDLKFYEDEAAAVATLNYDLTFNTTEFPALHEGSNEEADNTCSLLPANDYRSLAREVVKRLAL